MHRISFELTDAEVQQLREVVDGLAIRDYGQLVFKVLPALPLLPLPAEAESEKVVLLRRIQVFPRLPHGDSL